MKGAALRRIKFCAGTFTAVLDARKGRPSVPGIDNGCHGLPLRRTYVNFGIVRVLALVQRGVHHSWVQFCCYVVLFHLGE